MYETGRSANVPAAILAAVDGPAGLADAIQAMLDDLAVAGDEWENGTLPRYLEALGAFVTGRFDHPENPAPDLTWRSLAETLVAASGYE